MRAELFLPGVPKTGIIVPIMGSPAKRARRRSGLADALFTPVQQRVLALLFGQADRRFQSAELIRLARGGSGAAQRQLARLEQTGLIQVHRVGNQKHYQANRESPIFAELHGLVLKTVGLVEPIRAALAPIAKRIDAAFIYGSIAGGTDRASSDVDLLLISDSLAYADVYDVLLGAESVVGRAINPTVMSRAEWMKARAKAGSFAARVKSAPRLFVIGDENDLA